MRDLIADTFLIFFCISIIFTYFGVRLRWLKLWATSLIGIVSSGLFMFLFSVIRQTSVLQAVIVSISVGVLFTITTVSIAAFFEANTGKRESK